MLNLFLKRNGALKANFVCQVAELYSAPTDLLWEDDERLIIVCADGKLVNVSRRIIPETNQAVKTNEPVKDCGAEKSSTTKKSPIQSAPKSNVAFPSNLEMNDFDDSSDEERTEKTATIRKSHVPSAPNFTAGCFKKSDTNDVDDSSEDDDFGTIKESPAPIKPKKNQFVDDEAADDEDDESVSPMKQRSPAFPQAEETAYPDKDDDASEDEYEMPDRLDDRYSTAAPVNLPESQPAFAPSSSPLELPRRFMCWNHIGSITLRRDDTGEGRSTVDINFTDSGFRRPVGFTDNLGFILGSLGEDGGIFATDLADEDDDGSDDLLNDFVPGLSEKTKLAVRNSQRKQDPNKPTGSSIYFQRFETFGSLRDKDWYLTLPNGERALGCATGEGWAAVMTRYVSL